MKMRLARVAATVALFLLVSVPVAEAATPVPSAGVVDVDYTTGMVVLGAHHATDTVQVVLAHGSTVLGRADVRAGSRKTLLSPYALKAAVALRIIGRSVDGRDLWEQRVNLDPAAYRPTPPVLGTANGAIVGSGWHTQGSTARPATSIAVFDRSMWESRVATRADEPFTTFSLTRLPAYALQPTSLDVVARNGFGASPPARLTVYNLGSGVPRASRYVFVSRRTCWMFHVLSGRVIGAWPIAVGTPQTPTPTGDFRIAGAQPAGGDWGVLRRRLYRVTSAGRYATRYYIHGTNDPWSIGTPASHGCIRMYNRDVRRFARVVPNNTLVRIR